MKFKKYIKESTETPVNSKFTLNEEFDNPYSPPITAQEVADSLYRDLNTYISEGNYEAANAELTEFENEFKEFAAKNDKRKLFKFPKFMVEKERELLSIYRKRVDSMKKDESIQDMNNRCENCNTLLNDSGTCPKCDDGQETHFNSDMLEELSVREKLKAAYPELNFDKPVTEQCVNEELSNKEKLLKAFPELSFDKEPLTEGIGADTADAVKETMQNLAKDDKNEWAKKTAEIIDAVPNSFMDELFDAVKNGLSNVRLNDINKKKIIDAAEVDVDADNIEGNTLGNILDAIDVTTWAEKNPEFIKSFLIVVLGIIAVIEPTPVVEIITAIVTMIPSNVIAKIASILSVVTNPVAAGIAIANRVTNEELSNREKLKAAYPELNFDNNLVEESQVTDFNYDDNYEIDDDVELDRRHASLYGGDRMYCDCGRKLSYNEYGSYCPVCEPEDPENKYEAVDISNCYDDEM